MKTKMMVLSLLAVVISLSIFADPACKNRVDKSKKISSSTQVAEVVISRSDYIRRLEGFWLGINLANRTSIVTENEYKEAPFLTDEDWGKYKGRNGNLIDWVFVLKGKTWTADDDTDIEYIYQHTMYHKKKSILSPEDIRDAWLNHIHVHKEGDPGPWQGKVGEPTWLWASNARAFNLMRQGILPPASGSPPNNMIGHLIDAQLTTEIFGLYAPARPDVGMKLAYLPIRTVGYHEAVWISEFYVIMHSLASYVDPGLSMQEKTVWLAEQARKHLPDGSVSAHMYDFIKADYLNNPDKNNWEKTRDAVYQNYQINGNAGYKHTTHIGSEINFAAGMVSWFYGQGDYKRTVQIGTLCGWDSDNPTSTWGGLLGFLMGVDGVKNLFSDKELSNLYEINNKRKNFPDHTPDQPGEDTFELMAQKGAEIIDRVILEEMNGSVDLIKGEWTIPDPGEIVLKETEGLAQVDFTTAQGYVNGDLSTQVPSDGVTWTAPATHFLVDATAGKVSIPDASAWQRAKYNRAFASGITTFTLAKKFSFDRSLDAYTGNHPIMGFYLQHASNNLYFDFTFNRSGATNYGLGYFINATEVINAERWRNTGGITPAALGFLDAEDTSSDELTLELTLTKGIDADSWTAVGKVLNGSTEVFSWDFGGTPFKVGETFHNSTSLYGGLSAREGMANSKISNRTVTSFLATVSIASGLDVLGAEAALIYPNPVKDVLNVSSSDVKKIEIFNLSGKLVKSVQLKGSQVDVSDLAKGLYLLKLNGSTTSISRIIKM